MCLNELAKAIHNTARNKGFYDKPEKLDEYINRACANLHDEVSELHEAFREHILWVKTTKDVELLNIEEELADIIIRALDTSYYLQIDIQRAVDAKMAYNEKRPYRHGNKAS